MYKSVRRHKGLSKRASTKRPYCKRALRQKGLVTKGPDDKRASRLKDKHLKGITIAGQVKAELLLPLTADSYYSDSIRFIFIKKCYNFSGRLDSYSTAKKIYFYLTQT
jgi:hypothetical protein